MNDKRRAKLHDAQRMLQHALDAIEQVLDDERDALQGIPENMAERVERCEGAISDLEDAKSSAEEAIRQLESAVDR
jgi:predicted  nucleic acid-binding Zn-ribbon protein